MNECPKYIHLSVTPNNENDYNGVKMKVPFGIVKAGVKLSKILPKKAMDKLNRKMEDNGMDFLNLEDINSENFEEIFCNFKGLSIDVEGEKEQVSILFA